MSVYVDDMYLRPMGRYGRMRMSHMIADTDSELHTMAARIGLARRWFQGDHYDVCMALRERAIAAGALPITMRQLAAMAGNRRAGLPLGDPGTALAAAEQRWRLAAARETFS
ncbi:MULTISPECIES: DUF4031 domain-containing protein [unclassified Xanthobacter]|uniref:DUF4031 domain-containing protein n=1 Tax=unclassified Xanthobacter TaxID=2623496 RepID=UPI001F463AC3|nr:MULTISPECIES: DUF4031 domain-containing protein [unclassified Xanthobacter]